jgi:RNA polymerase sigma factor (TIGR02999 family)
VEGRKRAGKTRRRLDEPLDHPTVRERADPDPEAAAALLPEVYDELKRIARADLRRQPMGHSLDPTEVVHEAYARLSSDAARTWNDRIHFVAVAATAMRHLLVDHARRKGAARRGGGWQRVTLSGVASLSDGEDVAIEDLHRALEDLARLDPRQARIVELRFFGGLTIDEVATALDLGTTTVENHWTFAKAWLHERLAQT